MAADKDNVIYLEVDEDITSAIDKLGKAPGDAVQIVAAKRSTLMQSVINLRLLKKAAADSKKKLLLVSGDRVTQNLAGRIGLPVALQVDGEPIRGESGPAKGAADDEIDGGVVGDEPEKPKKPEAKPADEMPMPEDVVAEPKTEQSKPKPQVKKTQRVPNFNQMQKRILWIGGGVFALLLLLALNYYFTSAKVTLFAKADQVNSSFGFTADPTTTNSDPKAGVLAASQLSFSKSLTASVTATGQKDNGTKAHGQITVSNCYDNSPHTLVAGTRFAAPDGKIFHSDSEATVPGGQGSFFGCTTPGKVNVGVTADQNGDGYNLAAGTKYTIPALPSSQQAGIYGTGDQMTGGTAKISKVVTQGDVDKAKQTALDSDKEDGAKAVKAKVGKNQTLLEASIQQNVTSLSSNPDVGAESPTASLTIQVAYTGLAVAKSELSDLAKAQEQKQIGDDQQIYEDGSDNLKLSADKPTASGAIKFSAEAAAFAGKKIDTAALAKKLVGKKYGEAADTAKNLEGVDKAEIVLTPGWATSMPGILKHIHVSIKANLQ
ncbi:MAG TPA: hypothetical protein VLF21_03640 [Candidatus Saccharimonadales bacterium]|nr:hypothetical protein [Candidatus Saccharimonadales bacterium]